MTKIRGWSQVDLTGLRSPCACLWTPVGGPLVAETWVTLKGSLRVDCVGNMCAILVLYCMHVSTKLYACIIWYDANWCKNVCRTRNCISLNTCGNTSRSTAWNYQRPSCQMDHIGSSHVMHRWVVAQRRAWHPWKRRRTDEGTGRCAVWRGVCSVIYGCLWYAYGSMPALISVYVSNFMLSDLISSCLIWSYLFNLLLCSFSLAKFILSNLIWSYQMLSYLSLSYLTL